MRRVPPKKPLAKAGKVGRCLETQVRRPARARNYQIVGCDDIGEIKMITAIKNNSTFRSNYLSMIGAALLGLAIVTISGHVQGNVLHDAAHDVRHTTGFPRH